MFGKKKKNKIKRNSASVQTKNRTKTNIRNKVEPKDEFRTHKTSGHPTYIYAKVGDKYKYIGITHSPITNKTSNIELSKNPNPKDNKKAYAKPQAQMDKTKKFKNQTKKDWELSKKDKEKLKPILK